MIRLPPTTEGAAVEEVIAYRQLAALFVQGGRTAAASLLNTFLACLVFQQYLTVRPSIGGRFFNNPRGLKDLTPSPFRGSFISLLGGP